MFRWFSLNVRSSGKPLSLLKYILCFFGDGRRRTACYPLALVVHRDEIGIFALLFYRELHSTFFKNPYCAPGPVDPRIALLTARNTGLYAARSGS